MVRAATCSEQFNGHCNHWGLDDAAHALIHTYMRRIEEVAIADKRAGLFMTGGSTSTLADDASRFVELLADEGYAVVPLVRA